MTGLVGFNTASYDDLGEVFSSTQFSVNPTTGAISSSGLTSETWYDNDGNVLESLAPSGLAEKFSYDGLDRETEQYITDGGAVNNDGSPILTYAAASSVADDDVIEQTAYGYDADSNVIETVDAQRLSSDSNATTGALFSDAPITDGLDVTPTGTGAAIYYSASYYDADDRDIADENVGTNGGSPWTRPSSPDASDATHLVTTYGYDAAGNQDTVTDPAGLVTQSYFDALGRTTETIADYTDGTPTDDSNQTTAYTYDGDNNVLTQTAIMPSGTPNQTTAYVYGVITSGGSAIDSNDLLAKVEYPDATTGDASTSVSNDVSTTYDALGETLTKTDQNGTKHTYGYDTQGREISDTATIASENPENIDTSVVELTYDYNNQGLAYQQTSLNSSDGIVNQDEEIYNGLGQLTNQYQSVSGAVDTSTTPDTQYVYATDDDGNPIDGSRQIEMIYPNGRIEHYGYDNSTLDNAISRVDYQADDNGSGGVGSHLADYEYQGLSTIIQQTDGNGVTENITLDQFGRTAEIKYVNSDSVTTDDFQYGYNQDGDVLYEDNTVDSSLSNLYTYDGLNRITSDDQGTLNSDDNAITGTPTNTQSWTYDALGNQIAVTTDGTGVDSTVNSQNELTENGANTLTYDDDGNTTTDENGNTDTYNAWNELISVKSGSTTIASYTYDASSNRITQTESGATTDLYLDSSGQVIEQRQGSTVTAQNVFSLQYINDLVEEDQGTSRYYYQQDANYNVTAITDTSGTVLERYTYDAYGSVTVRNADGTVKGDGTIASSGYGTVYLFQGGRLDPVTGLYFFNSTGQGRDYDPSTGTWREEDSGGYSTSGPNLYQAFGESPVGYVDPTGQSWYNPTSWNWSAVGQSIATGTNAVGNGIADFVSQVVPGFDDVQAPGVRNQNPNSYAGLGGRIVGRTIGGILSGGEVIGGGALVVTSIPEDATLVGVLVGAPQAVGGIALAAYGIRTLANVSKPFHMSSISSGGGGSGSGSGSGSAPSGPQQPCPAAEKPTLTSNPKHNPNSPSPEPSNVQELFDKSIADENGTRWAKDDNGVIHRFSSPSNGQSHWNGSTAGPNPIQERNIPIGIRRALK